MLRQLPTYDSGILTYNSTTKAFTGNIRRLFSALWHHPTGLNFNEVTEAVWAGKTLPNDPNNQLRILFDILKNDLRPFPLTLQIFEIGIFKISLNLKKPLTPSDPNLDTSQQPYKTSTSAKENSI